MEQDRYKNIDKNKRLCKFCSLNAIEDEIHFFLECPLYDEVRKVFLESVSKRCNNFNNLSTENKFIWLLSCKIDDICSTVASYCYRCFELRKR